MAIQKSRDSSSLADVIEIVLDKGVIIDLVIKVLVVGMELIRIEGRIVIASVDTWLRYAEAVGIVESRPQMIAEAGV